MRKILAIRFSGLGDIVMLLSTLKKLKDQEPTSITLLTDRSNADLMELSCGVIDEVVSINRSLFRQKSLKAIGEIVRLWRYIRNHSFNMVIDFQNFGETALITSLAKAKEKIGAPKKEKYHYAYTKIVPRDERGHRSQFFHRIAGVEDSIAYPKLCLNETAKAYRLQLQTRLDPSKKTIGLNIGSTQESRRWSEQNFLQIARTLQKNYNVLVFVGPLEAPLKAFFEGFVVVSDTTLWELAGALNLCDILISNDTGPVHMAAALGVKTVTLFSTGTDDNVGALTDKKAFVRKNPINAITPQEVLSILQKSPFA